MSAYQTGLCCCSSTWGQFRVPTLTPSSSGSKVVPLSLFDHAPRRTLLREPSLPILNALTRLLARAHSSASTPAPSPPLTAAPPTPSRSSFTMPPPAAWQPARARVQLKLSRERLRLLQQKKTQVAKQTRREVAGLLEKRKLESARIKVEGLLAEDLYVELLEVLEL